MFDHQSNYLSKFQKFLTPHNVIARNQFAELIHMRGNQLDIDPHYLLLSTLPHKSMDEPFMAKFGSTGMLQSAQTMSGKLLFERLNAYGNFSNLETENLEIFVNDIYELIVAQQATSKEEHHLKKFNWDYNKLNQRFGDFHPLVHGQIIPDYSDEMVAIPLALGCIDDCSWCTYAKSYSGGFHPYSTDAVKQWIDYAYTVVNKYHPQGSMKEAFFAASDIFWFKLVEGPNPIEAIDYFLHKFSKGPNVFSKRSGFFGVRSGLMILNRFPDADSYFKQTFKYFNRGLMGIETLEDELSARYGKPIPAEDKIKFAHYILGTGLEKLKLIVQTDLSPVENLYVTAEGLATLVKQYNRGNKPRLTVEVSLHIPGRGYGIVTDDKSAKGNEKYHIFEKVFRQHGIDLIALRPNYEIALPSFQWKDNAS